MSDNRCGNPHCYIKQPHNHEAGTTITYVHRDELADLRESLRLEREAHDETMAKWKATIQEVYALRQRAESLEYLARGLEHDEGCLSTEPGYDEDDCACYMRAWREALATPTEAKAPGQVSDRKLGCGDAASAPPATKPQSPI